VQFYAFHLMPWAYLRFIVRVGGLRYQPHYDPKRGGYELYGYLDELEYAGEPSFDGICKRAPLERLRAPCLPQTSWRSRQYRRDKEQDRHPGKRSRCGPTPPACRFPAEGEGARRHHCGGSSAASVRHRRRVSLSFMVNPAYLRSA